MTRVKTRFPGVYKRESASRRHNGKPDVCFEITFRDAQGKFTWEKVGFLSEGYTAASASELRARKVSEIRHGTDIPKKRKRLTLAEGFACYRGKTVTASKWSKTVAAMWEHHILPCLGQEIMHALKGGVIESFRDGLVAKGLSPQTVKHVLGSLRRVYRKLAEWEIYTGPIPAIKMPRVDGARLRYLTSEEAHALLDEIKRRSPKWWLIALVSLHTGMRLGEVLALRGQDVDLAGGVINVKDAKTGTRPAYLTQTVASELTKTIPVDPGALLFPSRHGKISRDSSDSFDRSVTAVGLNNGITDPRDRVVFHTLRHTFGSWAIQRGVAIEVVAKLMGHSTLEMTRRYAKLAPDQKRAAMEQIEGMWSTHSR